MRKLRVLHLIEGLGPGGAERLLYTNLKYLDGSRIQNHVTTVYPEANFWKGGIEELGIDVRTLGCSGKGSLGRGLVRLIREVRQFRPDLIHTHLWAANVLGRSAGWLLGVPVISSIHNPDYEPESLDDGSNVSSLKRYAFKFADKWTARVACSKLLAVSEYVRQSTAAQLAFPKSKIEVLYNPVDIESLSIRRVPTRDEVLRHAGMPTRSKIILNVGRLVPQKGLIYAIRAMPAVRAIHPDAHLVSIGECADLNWKREVQNEREKLGLDGFVHILGARSDIGDFLRQCDVFVFPSLHEGLGIALLEAMAMECAVIASDAGAIKEFVKDDENGLLVPPRTPEELSRAIVKVLDSVELKQRLGIAARETVMAQFLPTRAAERLYDIYQSETKTNPTS